MPILTTKLHIPSPRAEWVRRPQLLERLDAALHRRLTLVAAPAGFGKTSLVSAWVHRVKERTAVAWLSLDQGDNDPARFWAYLAAALQTARAGLGQGLADALRSPEPPVIESLLTGLLNEMSPTSGQGLLVLDDYHVITSPEITASLAFLVDHLPPQWHVLIISRADPTLPLPRLRARGDLLELRAADLRFRQDETAMLLNGIMTLALTASDVALLDERTEGWIAGLQLAGLAMSATQAGKARTEFIRAFSGSHRFVLDYLLTEVLLRESQEVQSFLLGTSVLDRLCGSLCDAILDRSGSQKMLEALERANLFIVAMDDERRWYRYHHLFAALLRGRLALDQREHVADLHRRASLWHQAEGMLDEAIGHALKAGEAGRAADMVETNAMPMLFQGAIATLRGWVSALPEEVVRSRPWLNTYHAWALVLSGQGEAAQARLAGVEESLGVSESTSLGMLEGASRHIMGHVMAIRTYMARVLGRMELAGEWARQSLELLPEEDLAIRGVVTFSQAGAAILSGDVQLALELMSQVAAMSERSGNANLAISAICTMASLNAVQGHLGEAHRLLLQAIDLGRLGTGRPSPVIARAYAALAALSYERNKLSEAWDLLEESAELVVRYGSMESVVNRRAQLARLDWALGNRDEAWKEIEAAVAEVGSHDLTPTTPDTVYGVWLWMLVKAGRLADAARVAEQRALSPQDDLAFAREQQHIALACLLAARAEDEASPALADESLGLLVRLQKAAEASGRVERLIRIRVIRALTCERLGRGSEAVDALAQAISLGREEGYTRVYLDEGPALIPILERIVATDPVLADLAGALLEGLRSERQAEVPHPIGSRTTRDMPDASLLLEPLTDREMEVLRLVIAGLSNRQIADRLYIALSTVKSHTNSIYGKLGVTSRTRAIARAQDLGIA